MCNRAAWVPNNDVVRELPHRGPSAIVSLRVFDADGMMQKIMLA